MGVFVCKINHNKTNLWCFLSKILFFFFLNPFLNATNLILFGRLSNNIFFSNSMTRTLSFSLPIYACMYKCICTSWIFICSCINQFTYSITWTQIHKGAFLLHQYLCIYLLPYCLKLKSGIIIIVVIKDAL